MLPTYSQIHTVNFLIIKDLSHSIEVFAMLPIVNVAAKGLIQFVSIITYTLGSNIYKLAIGTVT